MPGKVLIITYYWPPSGGAGVQRWLKFAKYLPSTGWMPVVLTVDPEYAAYPFTDISLTDEIPIDVDVHRTKATNYFSFYTKDPKSLPSAGFSKGAGKGLKSRIGRFVRGNFFIPDPRKGWNRYAFRKACELIKTEKINHIITTSPPHSTQLIGLRLKRVFPHIKWIADLRDPWTDIYYYNMFSPSPLARKIDSTMEKKVLVKADRIITVGHTLASTLAQKAENIDDKIFVIPNGFDEEDFENLHPTIPDIFTITYVGTLSASYPMAGFLRAVSELRASGRKLKLKFVGSMPDDFMEQIKSSLKYPEIEYIPYCDHTLAIKHMMDSSLLLLVIPDHLSSKSIITGKLFEYLASGKPVLYIGPTDGDAAQILARCGSHGLYGYNDIELIGSYIERNLQGKAPAPSGHHLEYSRRTLTSKLGGLIG